MSERPPSPSERVEPAARIPRDPDDDYAPAIVASRRRLAEERAGRPLPHLAGEPVPPAAARGNCENLVGYAQVPLGLAGPLVVHASDGRHEVLVPMATTEGALVASYSRGMGLLRASGGAHARVLREGLTQRPILVYDDARAAVAAGELARARVEELRAATRAITSHGALTDVHPEPVGRRLVLGLEFTTGDAIGINMAANAADRCARAVAEWTGARERYVHGEDVEKRANQRAFVEGRGRPVVADVTIPRAVLVERARVEPEALVRIRQSYAVGFARLGTQNWLVQSANGLAAVFLACGQDLAYVTECATGLLDLECTEAGDLYASAYLPSMLVGTVGGGSGQGTAAECLDLLGCRGDARANRFAELLAATVLAGDLSLMAAFCADEFVAAHERLGRNRPEESSA